MFSHMAISKGFLNTPDIVTWQKISEYMFPNCALCSSSTVSLGTKSEQYPATLFSQIMLEWFRHSHQ